MMGEAGAWVARLNGPLRTKEAEQGFRQWLEDHPQHADAFRLVTEGWEEMGDLKRFASVSITAPHRRAEITPTVPRQRRKHLLLAAATLALLSFAGVFYYLQLRGVSTSVGEQRTITLEDNTKVHLNTSTRIVVQYDKQRRHIRLVAGEALFEVAPHESWPFVVFAGDQEVMALGTAFLVRRDADKLAVTLMEGKIVVKPLEPSPGAGSPMGGDLLTPGDRLTFTGRQHPPKLDRPPLKQLVAWEQGQVPIDNLTLSEAVTEMNRYSAVKLSVDRSESRGLRVSGVFRAGESASFARAVAQSYGLRIADDADRIVLTGLPQEPNSPGTPSSSH